MSGLDPATLYGLVDSVLSSIDTDNLSEEAIQKLRFLFPEELLTAAFDLVDKESVIKYTTSWGRTQYEVLGSTTQYSVFPKLASSPSRPVYCACPTFAHSLLFEDMEVPLMCKHLLATLLAIQLKRCVERPLTEDDLATIVSHQA